MTSQVQQLDQLGKKIYSMYVLQFGALKAERKVKKFEGAVVKNNYWTK